MSITINLPRIIAVDFDGTLVTNRYPQIGDTNNFLVGLLKKEEQCGTKIILWTIREGALLKDAVDWCNEHGLGLSAVNENLPDIAKFFGYNPRKIYADTYIDSHMCTFLDLPYRQEGGPNYE